LTEFTEYSYFCWTYESACNKILPMNRKLILYIATSLDGYIAQPNDDLSFLSIVQQEGEDYGYADFIQSVDTVILGRKTYDWVMAQVPEFPHADKTSFVITRTARPDVGKTHFYTGNLQDLVLSLKTQEGKNIFCDGGAEIVHELLQHGLIDEFILSVVPVLVGNGTKLFKNGRPEQRLTLISTQQFVTGLVQLHYRLAI
jgi:dihydrofolate reductase